MDSGKEHQQTTFLHGFRAPAIHWCSFEDLFCLIPGLMRRFCDAEGEWNNPDTTECKTRELVDLAEKVMQTSDAGDAVAIVESLAHSSTSHSAIYAGDMVLMSEMLVNLAVIVSFFEDVNLNDTEKYIEILGPNKGIVTLFAALESVGKTIYDFMSRSGREVATSCGILDINGIFFEPNSNLVVGSRRIEQPARRRRSIKWNSTEASNSYVYLSQETLEKLHSARSEDRPLAVIPYIYSNVEDILPTDLISERSPGQYWVNSVTAVKRNKKVNTPVISVSVYPKQEEVIDLDVQMRFFEKEEGYAPRCLNMKPGTDHGIWSTSGCKVTHSGKRDILDYVECECNRLGTFAVIMIMEGNRRLTSDFYVVLAQAILSFAFFPTLVAVDVLSNPDGIKDEATLLVYCHPYRMLAELVKLFWGPEEEILSGKMQAALVIHLIFIATGLANFAVSMIADPIISLYALACCIFAEGSVIYLGFFATNTELLIVLRARYFEDDEEHRQALEDFEAEDSHRLQIQKERMENEAKDGKRLSPMMQLNERAKVQSKTRQIQYRNNDENNEVTTPHDDMVMEDIC
ncbi:uncharacterized protein [Ptychodera flava]|uniref:uncharacterized protein n=1 Tax=Ptychodera flava TaxID=63121 RepID=UPI00396A2529